MKYLIVNADDFGAGVGMNRGVAQAAQHGILTSVSLMVNMPGTAEAAGMIRSLPELSIGLHVNLTNEGRHAVVNLEDEQACRAQIRQQFECFRRLVGVPPTHLDAHHNIHRVPRLLPLFQELASEHNLPLREHSAVRYFSRFYGQWDGETHPEQIDIASLAWMLRKEIGDGCTELSCHPGYASPDFPSAYSREREMELVTLCDPTLPEVLRECGVQLTCYRKLKAIEAIEH